MYQKLLTKILGIFDIPSGPIVGLWSLVILIGCAYSIYTTKQVSAPVACIFSAVLTNFAAHKIAKVCTGTDQTSTGDNNGNDSAKS